MPVTKECRCCGRPMVFTEAALSVCPACGTHNARPRLEGVMLDNFRRAIRQQADRDFYNAEISYQYVLNSCPEEPEALWSRLLCHYGAVFVNDGGVRRWEIHMTRSTPLQEQGDYRLACELAEPSIREQYEADAAYIDNAMARIRELAQTCPPYDVFLCHKTTVIDGPGYTEDFRRANDLYRLLTAKGLRVFFAPVVLEGTAGEDYEAGIFHALDTAKVMLVVCSDLRHLKSLWVQSEWRRYLEKLDNGSDAHLIPLLYGGMTADGLPMEFRNRRLQAITMELNASEKVLEAVRRYVKPKRKPWRAALALVIVLAGLAGGIWAVYRAGQGSMAPGDGPEKPAVVVRDTPVPTAAGAPAPMAMATAVATETVTPVATEAMTPAPTEMAVPKATVAATPVATEAVAALELGDSGSDVRSLQTRLKELGYYKDTIDSDFDEDTETAVRSFQQQNGLAVDGKAGAKTIEKLYSPSARRAPAVQTPTSTPRHTAAPTPRATAVPETDIYLEVGSSGSRVRTLQDRLVELGWLGGKADGSYEWATAYAVKAFQKKHGLWEDGKAGPDTLTILYSNRAAKSSAPVASVGETLQEGDSGDVVRAMQKRLKELGYFSGVADGSFGTATKAAVIAFQTANGLKADGKADTATLNVLYSDDARDAAVLFGDGNEEAADSLDANTYAPLRPGDSGLEVRSLQHALYELGYYGGQVDGTYGATTEDAVRAFQIRNSVEPVDGKAGQDTLRALYSSEAIAAPAGQDVKLELETSIGGKPFVLELKAEGTLRTGWTKYDQTMMDGTWKVENGQLVLDMPYGSTIAENAEGGMDITVNYGQMGEKVYTMTAEQFAALTGAEVPAPAGQDVKLELETSIEGKPFVLELKANGTLRTGWTNYEQTMLDGTWKAEGGQLVLDMAYGSTIAENAEGGLDITVNYGQMGEKVYTMTGEQLAALTGAEVPAPAGQDVKLELETSIEGKPFLLELKADGTLRTGWTKYDQTMMDGTWKAEGGQLVLDMPYGSTIAENAEGGLDITVNYGQMGEKVYTMTGEQLAALTGAEVAVPAGQDVKLELETSIEGKPFVLELKAEGALRTGWTNYEQTMLDGTWKAENGKLVLDMPYGSTIAENAEGGLDITVNYGQMGEKVYTMTAEQFAALTGGEVAAPAALTIP